MSVSTENQKKVKPEIPSLKSLERDFGQKFAYPASTKTYLQGSRPDVKAPIRVIEQLPTKTGETESANPPIPVYDLRPLQRSRHRHQFRKGSAQIT